MINRFCEWKPACFAASYTQNAKHLDLLDAVGLVDRSRSGREVVYEAHVAPLGDVTAWLERVGSQWDDRLEALKKRF